MITCIYKRRTMKSNEPMYLSSSYAESMIDCDKVDYFAFRKNYSFITQPVETKDTKINVVIAENKVVQMRYFDRAWRTEEEIAVCKAEHKQQRRSYNDRVSFNGYTSNTKVTEAINEHYANCCY